VDALAALNRVRRHPGTLAQSNVTPLEAAQGIQKKT
jgi:hypothetical protein